MKSTTDQTEIDTICRELAAWAMTHTASKRSSIHPTPIPQLKVMRDDAATMNCSVYKPALAVIVQGKKEIFLGDRSYQYGVGQSLIVSVELPVRGFVIEATPDKPFLGFLLTLSQRQIFDLITELQPPKEKQRLPLQGMFVRDVDAPLIDCIRRLTRIIDTPDDIPFLAPMVIREIYYRLLTGEHGNVIRQIVTLGNHTQRIVDVISVIKADFTQTLPVEELAERANMSASSFHRHFKSVTSMSPLQYQKQLRLIEARRLMLTEDSDATHAAHQVGYESPSQFSREYSRMFGAPPAQDIQRLRVV
ncbi:MAG: AraC family transcriptional regulator [Chloroflexota bacterium]